jgi:hypothetical protein
MWASDAAVIPLAVWEVVDRRHLPVLAGAVCAALFALPTATVAVAAGQRTGLVLPLMSMLSVGGALALAVCLARGAFAGAGGPHRAVAAHRRR